METALADWIFATSDQLDPSQHPDYLTREVARSGSLTPEQKTTEEAAWQAEGDREHAAWLASGAPDLLAELVAARRTANLRAEVDRINKLSDEEAAAELTPEDEAGLAAWTAQQNEHWRLVEAGAISTIQLPEGTPMPSNVVQFPAEPATPKIRSRRVNAGSLAGKPVPERRWLVPDWIPSRQVTLLYGDGAVGKSLIALQLAAAVVAGAPWFGLPVEQGGVEFISAEDDRDELHRRLVDIARESRVPLGDFAGMHLTSLADEDAVLAALQDGRGSLVETDLYHELDEVLAESRPTLLILDTLADVFGGNEIVRQQVRAFVNMLRRLAIRYDTTVVVLAHPSLSGMSSGKGTSGSTAWSNSVRSRLYFNRVHDEDGREPDTDARVLRSMKANYGPAGSEIRMRWRAGMFVPEAQSIGGDPLIRASKADRVFLDLLAKYIGQNRYVGVSPGKSYAPTVFKDDASKEGVSKAHLADAMERLLASGRIENAPWGAPSRKLFRLFPAKGGPTIAY